MNKVQAILKGDFAPGIYRFTSHAAAQSICNDAESAHSACIMVNGRPIQNKRSFLKGFAAELHFPSAFGNNWDAFEDYLRDLSWLQLSAGDTFIILYDHAGRFITENPMDWAVARNILDDCIAWWLEQDIRVFFLLRGVNAQSAGVPAL